MVRRFIQHCQRCNEIDAIIKRYRHNSVLSYKLCLYLKLLWLKKTSFIQTLRSGDMRFKNKIANYLLNLDLVIACIALIILILVTFFGVFMRYFLNNPFIWQEEVQLWCFVWVIFFGASAAFRSGGHIAIDILVDTLPKGVQKGIEVFNYCVVMTILFYLFIQGSNLIEQMVTTSRVSNILRVPYSLIYSAFPIGCILMMINHTIATIVSLFYTKDNAESGEKACL